MRLHLIIVLISSFVLGGGAQNFPHSESIQSAGSGMSDALIPSHCPYKVEGIKEIKRISGGDAAWTHRDIQNAYIGCGGELTFYSRSVVRRRPLKFTLGSNYVIEYYGEDTLSR